MLLENLNKGHHYVQSH